jgi:endonuclease/exonuclease/phosphatase family metal-dependent hydrolase
MIVKESGKFGGTYSYKGEWEIIDHIFVSEGLKNMGRAKAIANSGKIHSFPYLLEEYKGNIVPFRTYAGTKYLGGYSDHLPVSIEISVP